MTFLKVDNYMFPSINKGDTFIQADHSIKVHQLNTDYEFTNTCPPWFSSHLTDRTQYVSLSNHCSSFTSTKSGHPWCLVHGPVPFSMYIKPLSTIIDSHHIAHHSFADDIQNRYLSLLTKHPKYFTLCSHV